MNIPPVELLGGVYRLEVRRGLVSQSPYPDIWMFCDMDTGEVLAFLAPAPLFHAMLPSRWSAGLAKFGRAVCQYDAPSFTIEGVPLVRTYHELFHGQVGHACVPVIGGLSDVE